MLSRKFDSVFDNDPFFEGHQKHMREMDRFFRKHFQDFHGSLGTEETSSRRRGRQDGSQEVATQSLFDFGGFDNMFSSMQKVMENMHKNFGKAARDPNSHVLSHSSFGSYSKVDGSEPKVFQASTSTRQAPGGLRETHKTLRDSVSGEEKMAIGRYIGDRGHVIQRQRNRRSGKEEENQDYVNMGEDEAREFDRQWKDQTHQYRGRQIDGKQHGINKDQKRPRAVRF